MAKKYSIRGNTQEASIDYRVDYKKELNERQYDAVVHFNGPILCIAGAGSGKTKTLVYRVARMIESGISPENILLLTFTRKAATNMLDRVASLIGDIDGKVAGGTYHSFANMLLRKYGQKMGIPSNFSIIDEADSGDIINLIRGELELTKKETRFPRKQTLCQIFSKSINQSLSIDEVMDRDYAHFFEHKEDIKLIYTAFTVYKRDNYLLDYDDLLIFLHRLLNDFPDIRQIISNKYKYIMADEYQDTNELQAKITILLASVHNNVMVVGDDAQSIYSFRGAKVKNILNFPNEFDDCKIIKLEQNYRSYNAILKAANKLMESAKDGYKKNLFTEKEEGEKPARVKCFSEEEQSMFIASRILDLREEGVKLSDIAVLFRSGFHSYSLEMELQRRNIPYVKWGGLKFLEAAHLKDVLAHMRVLHNPKDQVSWMRILLLIEGIGIKSATNISREIAKLENCYDLTEIKVRPKAKSGLIKLSNALKKASEFVDRKPARIIEVIAEYYYVLAKKKYDNYPKRIKDIDQLSLISDRFDSLADFLADVVLEPPKDSVDGSLEADSDDEELLILSTIHSAKGLEWKHVFIIWALEGRFPSASSIKNSDGLEEERRLMYVAMTRAEKSLTISYPSQIWDPASMCLMSEPSRFLNEIGDDCLEKWEISG